MLARKFGLFYLAFFFKKCKVQFLETYDENRPQVKYRESQMGRIKYFLNGQGSSDLQKTYSQVVEVHLVGLSLEALRENQVTSRGKPFCSGAKPDSFKGCLT